MVILRPAVGEKGEEFIGVVQLPFGLIRGDISALVRNPLNPYRSVWHAPVL